MITYNITHERGNAFWHWHIRRTDDTKPQTIYISNHISRVSAENAAKADAWEEGYAKADVKIISGRAFGAT